MKWTFYISWITFILLMIINKLVNGYPSIASYVPYWATYVFKLAQFISYFMLAAVPMIHKYEGLEKPKGHTLVYLEALVISFFVRSLLFIFSFFKVDNMSMDNRMDILASFGGFMLLYYIFEIRLKIKRLEDKYFKY